MIRKVTCETRISIDPGISGTGFAIWGQKEWPSLAPPLEVGVYYPCDTSDWLQRVHSICSRVQTLIAHHLASSVYCEFPALFDSVVGRAAAAKGDVFKLTYLVGCFGEMCRQQGVEFVPIPVAQWKGQLPKSVVESRIQQRLGEPVCQKLKIVSHAWDAVGIGLYAKGHFE